MQTIKGYKSGRKVKPTANQPSMATLYIWLVSPTVLLKLYTVHNHPQEKNCDFGLIIISWFWIMDWIVLPTPWALHFLHSHSALVVEIIMCHRVCQDEQSSLDTDTMKKNSWIWSLLPLHVFPSFSQLVTQSCSLSYPFSPWFLISHPSSVLIIHYIGL